MRSIPSRISLTEALEAASETRCLEIGRDLLGRTPSVFRQFFAGKSALVVADTNTLAAAGRTVLDLLRRAGCSAEPFTYSDPNLYAEHRFVVALEEALKSRPETIPVAVGAGTINDITKLASHRTGRRYLTVATAASVDGYTAFGAAITYQGLKQTFACPAPLAVVADLDVIAAAPTCLNASGYADLLAKAPAGADWLVADALGAEAITEKPWAIVQGGLRQALADPAGVRQGDFEALRELTEGLMLAGFAMQCAGSSRCAAGGEHQFSHVWEMQHHTHNGKAPSHGFKVGIGSLAMTALYEDFLLQPVEQLDLDQCCAQWPHEAAWEKKVRALFTEPDILAGALEETRAKSPDVPALREQLALVRRIWPALRQQLRAQLIPFREVKAMLQAAGAPVEPEQIGISRQRLRTSFWQAYAIRRRFTLLDLAARTGLLESSLDRLFGKTGPWPLGSE